MGFQFSADQQMACTRHHLLGSTPKKLVRLIAAALTAGTLIACPAIPTPGQKATETARELNDSARWGRMDLAVALADPEYKNEFMKHRASWHGHIKLIDTEVTNLTMNGNKEAVVQIDVSWLYDDNTSLRVTRLKQDWSHERGRWLMTAEERIDGATGLFGEEVERADKKKSKQFPTRVIR